MCIPRDNTTYRVKRICTQWKKKNLSFNIALTKRECNIYIYIYIYIKNLYIIIKNDCSHSL